MQSAVAVMFHESWLQIHTQIFINDAFESIDREGEDTDRREVKRILQTTAVYNNTSALIQFCISSVHS